MAISRKRWQIVASHAMDRYFMHLGMDALPRTSERSEEHAIAELCGCMVHTLLPRSYMVRHARRDVIRERRIEGGIRTIRRPTIVGSRGKIG